MLNISDDVCELILEHKAAMCIQRYWTRFFLFSHARHSHWGDLKQYLERENLWSSLWRYSRVRREWRQEPESWLCSSPSALLVIRNEAELEGCHWWGSKSVFPKGKW